MITIVSLVVVLAAIAYVGLPLLEVSEERRDRQGNPELGEALLERDDLFAAMAELDSDYGMGNLSEADYRQLKTSYEEKALGVLRRLDAFSYPSGNGTPHQQEDEIERQVLEARRGRSEAPRATVGRFCSRCGTALDPADNYCPSCGAVAREEGV